MKTGLILKTLICAISVLRVSAGQTTSEILIVKGVSPSSKNLLAGFLAGFEEETIRRRKTSTDKNDPLGLQFFPAQQIKPASPPRRRAA